MGFCACFALSFLYAVLSNYWPGPFVDYWIDIPNVEKFFNGTLTLHDLISAHANVHRLFIPRLLFIADYRYFSGSNVLLILVSIICKMAMLLLFNHIIKDQASGKKLLLNMLFFAAILNAANISNVLHNSNLQWDLVSVFSCFAIYFFSQKIQAPLTERMAFIGWALFFFACGFLSQAGALPVLFVFVFISLLNKKYIEFLFGMGLMILVAYLTFVVLPVNEPEKPTYQGALAMMIFKLKYVALYVFKMFSGSIYFIDDAHFIFSWIILGLFVLGLVFAHKTKNIYNNVFLHVALFAFLMMVTIAAARVDFAPNAWPANRYQTNALLFILSLSLHSYFSVSVWLRDQSTIKVQNIIFIFSLGSFLITQYYLNNYGTIFANKVFSAQAYMLTHGVNQNNGADLLPSLQEYDRIAAPDPFFRQHRFAYYANKQGGDGMYKDFKKVGEIFLTGQDKKVFVDTCQINTGFVQYSHVEGGEGLQFSVPINIKYPFFPKEIFSRNTYYVLDTDGVVTGFSYIFIDPDHQYSRAGIRAYVSNSSARYIAEIDKAGRPVCLYALDQNTIPAPSALP